MNRELRMLDLSIEHFRNVCTNPRGSSIKTKREALENMEERVAAVKVAINCCCSGCDRPLSEDWLAYIGTLCAHCEEQALSECQ